MHAGQNSTTRRGRLRTFLSFHEGIFLASRLPSLSSLPPFSAVSCCRDRSAGEKMKRTCAHSFSSPDLIRQTALLPTHVSRVLSDVRRTADLACPTSRDCLPGSLTAEDAEERRGRTGKRFRRSDRRTCLHSSAILCALCGEYSGVGSGAFRRIVMPSGGVVEEIRFFPDLTFSASPTAVMLSDVTSAHPQTQQLRDARLRRCGGPETMKTDRMMLGLCRFQLRVRSAVERPQIGGCDSQSCFKHMFK
jgi:hypothetical protein